MNVVSALAVAALFGAGVHLMLRGDAVKLAAGTLLLTNSAVLFLISAGFGARRAPILPLPERTAVADPLVQALALTAVVIGFGTTVLLLRVGLAIERTHGTIRMDELVEAEVREDPEDDAPPPPSDAPSSDADAERAPPSEARRDPGAPQGGAERGSGDGADLEPGPERRP